MKRKGFLIEQITDLNNLYEAFYKAQKGKNNKPETIHYQRELYQNLKKIQNQIETGNLELGNYRYFTIYEPKKRLICAASFAERVLHHALMNVCHVYFENEQIAESYATRINKGTYKAIEKAKYFSKHYNYYIKFDIRKYFDSIAHSILITKLQRVFKDPLLLYLFHQIIESYHSSQNTGLPIGNLTSQYFANFYLSSFDRYIKQHLQIKPYVRYMDDFIIWTTNPSEINTLIEQVTFYLKEELNLDLKIKYNNTCKHGLNFLSYRIFSNKIELQQKSKKRFIEKTKLFSSKYSQNEFTEKEYQQHLQPLTAFTLHASAKGFRQKVYNISKKELFLSTGNNHKLEPCQSWR